MTILHFITALFLAAALAITARIIFMLRCRTRVLGTVISHDYSRDLRNRDEDLWVADRYRYRQRNRYRSPPRDVTLRVDYSYNGKSYRNDVHGWVKRGSTPDTLASLWIDPDNPNNVTPCGPGYWFIILLIVATGALLWRPAGIAILHEMFPTCSANGVGCKRKKMLLKPRAEEMLKDRDR